VSEAAVRAGGGPVTDPVDLVVAVLGPLMIGLSVRVINNYD